MIAPTHIALGTAVAMMNGLESLSLAMVIVGSVLPDIDHPKSFIGKVFTFASIPLNERYGHRKFIHSLCLWGPLTVLMHLMWTPGYWLCIGVITHLLLDCFNTSGVHLFSPLTEKTFVLLSYKRRIATGTKAEYVVLSCLWLTAWLTFEINQLGGLKYSIGYVTGSPKIAREYYLAEGERICYMTGYLRFPNGAITQDSYQVIGAEGMFGLAIWDHRQNKVLHLPKDANFLACWMRPGEKDWNQVRVDTKQTIKLKNDHAYTFGKLEGYMGEVWQRVDSGDTVEGFIIYESGIVELSAAKQQFSFFE